MAIWRHAGTELWSRAAGVVTWRYRGLEPRCRRGDAEARRYGALETRCSCSDKEVWRSVVRYGPGDVEVWSSGGAL